MGKFSVEFVRFENFVQKYHEYCVKTTTLLSTGPLHSFYLIFRVKIRDFSNIPLFKAYAALVTDGQVCVSNFYSQSYCYCWLIPNVRAKYFYGKV